MTISIRTMQPTDIPQLLELMSELGYPTTFEELKKRFELLRNHVDYETLVAVKDDKVIGFAGMCKALAYEFTGIYVRILSFTVSSKQRQKGVGRILLIACEEWAIEQGAEVITLNSGIREERQIAHLFYLSNGYTAKSTGFIKKIK